MEAVNMNLPYFSSNCVTSDESYYSFDEKRLLFVNVERDFARITPLIEAAIAYSQNYRVYFLDFSQVRLDKITSRLNVKFYDFFRGGNFINRIVGTLNESGIRVLKFPDKVQNEANAELTEHEVFCMSLAIRNQEIGDIVSTSQAKKRLEENYDFYRIQISKLSHILDQFDIDRLFVWNGRFELSTLVAIAGERKECEITKVEWGSEINHSFEIFRKPPRNRHDVWARSRHFKREIENGTRLISNTASIENIIGEWKINRFSSRFLSLDTFDNFNENPYVVFYTSSFWEASTYGKNVQEQDSRELQCVINLCRVAISKGYKVYIRVHPNPWSSKYEKYETEIWTSALKHFSENDVRIIAADSEVNSYEIANSSRAVFTIWSSIGFETLSNKIPTYFFADYIYESEHSNDLLRDDVKSIEDFLVNLQSPSLDFFRFIVLYRQNYGYRFKYFSKSEDGKIFFRGRYLLQERENLGPIFRILSTAKKLFLSVSGVIHTKF
jgi:hypothetical protein